MAIWSSIRQPPNDAQGVGLDAGHARYAIYEYRQLFRPVRVWSGL